MCISKVARISNFKEHNVIKYIAGVVTGIVICTVGFTGIARILDNSVTKVQSVAKEAAN